MTSSDDYWYVSQRAREAHELSRAHIQRCGTDSGIGRPVIEGTYHPHLVDGPGTNPIDAGIEALGQTYLTAIAGFLAEVSLPRLDMAHKTSGPHRHGSGPMVRDSTGPTPNSPTNPTGRSGVRTEARVGSRSASFVWLLTRVRNLRKTLQRQCRERLANGGALPSRGSRSSHPRTLRAPTSSIGQGAHCTCCIEMTRAALGAPSLGDRGSITRGDPTWASV